MIYEQKPNKVHVSKSPPMMDRMATLFSDQFE